MYYIETEDLSLFRGCGFYTIQTVMLGLRENLITKEDIKLY